MEASKILDFLFLGRNVDSIQERETHSLGVTHILNVKESAKFYDSDEITTLHVPLSDYGESDLTNAFEKCLPFIESVKNSHGKILVHCRSGQNRSTAVVLGYLMLSEGMSLRESWETVSSKRPTVAVCEPYWRQLEKLEVVKHGVSSFSCDELAAALRDALKKLE